MCHDNFIPGPVLRERLCLVASNCYDFPALRYWVFCCCRQYVGRGGALWLGSLASWTYRFLPLSPFTGKIKPLLLNDQLFVLNKEKCAEPQETPPLDHSAEFTRFNKLRSYSWLVYFFTLVPTCYTTMKKTTKLRQKRCLNYKGKHVITKTIATKKPKYHATICFRDSSVYHKKCVLLASLFFFVNIRGEKNELV